MKIAQAQDLQLAVLALAQSLCESDPQLRLVKNEEDDSDKQQLEAATFLKLNGKRLGRDLELYGFMIRIGAAETAAQLLEEIVLPIKRVAPKAFAAGMAQLRTFDVFEEKQAGWLELLDSLL